MVGQSINDITVLRAGLGTIESRVQAASDRMTRERSVIDLRTSALESVDPYEAKVHFDQLSTQIEMSYALTVRLSNLSILNYA
jgi:flagellar hook-associated protein 3 FlgL